MSVDDVSFRCPHLMTCYSEGDVERADVGSISPETLTEVEADCFWCLTKLLDGIQVEVMTWDTGSFWAAGASPLIIFIFMVNRIITHTHNRGYSDR